MQMHVHNFRKSEMHLSPPGRYLTWLTPYNSFEGFVPLETPTLLKRQRSASGEKGAGEEGCPESVPKISLKLGKCLFRFLKAIPVEDKSP